MTSRLGWGLAALAFFATLGTILSQPQRLGAQVDELFAPWDRKDSPGCVVHVRHNGKPVHERAYGMAHLELGVPLSLSSVFLLASVSKQFVVFAIMLLMQSGRLSLDDDVRKYVPELPDFGKTITIRHLIHHTSGLREDLTLFNLAGWRSGDTITRADFLRLVKNQKELNFPPGDQYLYCNTGYHLLALIVERVSHQPFPAFAQEKIFAPLGMKSTVVRDNHRTLIPNLAAPYGPKGSSAFELRRVAHDPPGASNVHSTVGDLALWDQHFYDAQADTQKLLTLMQQPAKLNSGKLSKYGGGLMIDSYRGLKTVAHTGSHGGYKTVLLRFPEQRFSVIVLANLSTFQPMRMAKKVADIYLKDRLEPKEPLPAEAGVPERELNAFVGEYRLGPNIWHVRKGKEGLFVQIDGGEKKRLIPSAAAQFFDREDETRYRFFDGKKEKMLEVRTGKQVVVGPRLRYVDLPKEKRSEYAGTYWSGELQAFGKITERDGKLFLQLPKAELELRALPSGELLARPSDAFYAWLSIRFFTDDNGKVAGYRLSTERIRNVRYDRAKLSM